MSFSTSAMCRPTVARQDVQGRQRAAAQRPRPAVVIEHFRELRDDLMRWASPPEAGALRPSVNSPAPRCSSRSMVHRPWAAEELDRFVGIHQQHYADRLCP